MTEWFLIVTIASHIMLTGTGYGGVSVTHTENQAQCLALKEEVHSQLKRLTYLDNEANKVILTCAYVSYQN